MIKNITISFLVTVIIALVCVIVFKENKLNQVTIRQPEQQSKVIANSTNIQDPNNPGVSTYTSYKLGVRFSYQNSMVVGSKARGTLRTVTYVPTESQNSIELNGHVIEVFSKDPQDTLIQAIEKKFLAGYSPNDCFVEAINVDSGYQKASISYPAPINSTESVWANSYKCPKNYSKTNGVTYFLYNTAVPDRFAFITAGQDVAALSPGGKNDFVSTVEIISAK